MNTSSNWEVRFMQMAELVSTWSKDPSTKVGCIIVGDHNEILAVGYNGLPRGIDDDEPEYWERPAKYLYAEHAERNAFYNAARTGTSLIGATLFVKATPALYPCADCVRGMIQVGINEVFSDPPNFRHPQWGESNRVASELLQEAKIGAYTLEPEDYEV